MNERGHAKITRTREARSSKTRRKGRKLRRGEKRR
jgi:hypothetical protein